MTELQIQTSKCVFICMVRIQLLKCRHLVSSERPQGVQDISLGPVGISQVLWRPLPFWSGSRGPDCAVGHFMWSYE